MNLKKTIVATALAFACAVGVGVPTGSHFSVMPNNIITVSAADSNTVSSASAVQRIQKAVGKGVAITPNAKDSGSMKSVANNVYTTQGGGTIVYTSLVNPDTGLPNAEFENLTSKSKELLLKDMYSIARATQEADRGNIADSTVNTWLTSLENTNGIGTKLLSTVLADSKPDFVSAQRILSPFNGPVNTAIAIVAILTMSLLGLTMALDLFYINIPAVRLLLDPDGSAGSGNGRGDHKGKMKLISHEAVTAVQQAEGGSGSGKSQGGSENKIASGIYLKHRVFGLVAVGLCLLYLVQGQIYTFVSWFLDLFSGLVGF